jgi:hypothetical protein
MFAQGRGSWLGGYVYRRIVARDTGCLTEASPQGSACIGTRQSPFTLGYISVRHSVIFPALDRQTEDELVAVVTGAVLKGGNPLVSGLKVPR